MNSLEYLVLNCKADMYVKDQVSYLFVAYFNVSLLSHSGWKTRKILCILSSCERFPYSADESNTSHQKEDCWNGCTITDCH